MRCPKVAFCHNFLFSCASLIVVFVVAGCAATGSVVVSKQPSVSLSTFRCLEVAVTSDYSGSEELTTLVEGLVIGKLRKKNLFEEVISGRSISKEKVDLQLKVSFADIKRVSGESRAWLGALAGRASLVTYVELINASSKELLASANIEGKSSGGSVFAGTTHQAAGKLADTIVDFVCKNI